MADISASMVKELRERTAAGMMDCKKALQECSGDMEGAVDWLRQKGLSKAAKRAGRATSEGVVASLLVDGNNEAALAEVMCETDFVARGDQFQNFAQSVVQTVFDKDPADLDALSELLGTTLTDQIATIGENITLGRFCRMKVQGNGLIGCYIHANKKIGVLVEMSCEKEESAKHPKMLEIARNIAMQVAATNPLALDASELDPAVVEREREVFRQKTLDEGKPANIVDKIVDGRIKKFYSEVCLIEQPYIRDDKLSVKDMIAAEAKELADSLNVTRYVRLQLGENAEA